MNSTQSDRNNVNIVNKVYFTNVPVCSSVSDSPVNVNYRSYKSVDTNYIPLNGGCDSCIDDSFFTYHKEQTLKTSKTVVDCNSMKKTSEVISSKIDTFCSNDDKSSQAYYAGNSGVCNSGTSNLGEETMVCNSSGCNSGVCNSGVSNSGEG